MSTDGLKEPDDILGVVRALRDASKATSVSVIGFSTGGVCLAYRDTVRRPGSSTPPSASPRRESFRSR